MPATVGHLESVKLPALWKLILLVITISVLCHGAKPKMGGSWHAGPSLWSVHTGSCVDGPVYAPDYVSHLVASGQARPFQQLPSRHMAGLLRGADCPAAGSAPATPRPVAQGHCLLLSPGTQSRYSASGHLGGMFALSPACDNDCQCPDPQDFAMPAAGGDAAGSTTALMSAGANFISRAAAGNRLLGIPGWLLHRSCLCPPRFVAFLCTARAAAAQVFCQLP